MGDPVKIEGGTAVVCNVPVVEATRDEGVLPERVQEALGQLVGAARDGLLALSVEVGLGVLREVLELKVDELVGPKGRWNPDRTAVRHGHEDGEVTLGGRRVGVKRPRARTADGEGEVALVTYEHFADRDQLGDVVLERMLAGVSTRKYRRAQEPVGTEVETDARSTSKSVVSRTGSTRNATCWTISPSATVRRSRFACVAHGPRSIMTVRSSSSRPGRSSSTVRTPAPPVRYGRDGGDAHGDPARDHRQAQVMTHSWR